MINLMLLLSWGIMDKGGSEARRSERLIWVPVLLYVIAIIVFYWLNIGATYQSQPLLLAMIFATTTCLPGYSLDYIVNVYPIEYPL